jgi:hypothetical protein
MKTMTIRHHPWVGDLFHANIAPRLMILGESHHGENREATDMTAGVVEEWLSGISNPAYRFFTHLAVAISGEEPFGLSRREVFRRIMFYNYVLAVMPGSRAAPTGANFAESEAAFREVVEEHRPTHIVVCGKRLWDNMPSFDPPNAEGQRATLGDEEFCVGRYRTANAAPLAMCIRHPQSGFNGRKWHPRLQAFNALQ